MAEAKKEPTRTFVAIDFGTTYSGFAFSFSDDPKKIFMKNQSGAAAERKIPTAVLLNKAGEFDCFGKAALDKYLNLEDEDLDKWLFFDRFKMNLQDDSVGLASKQIKAANGKTMSALTVFSRSLQYFYAKAKEEISRFTGTPFVDKETKWILTVPAIWGDRAKDFMKLASREAGFAGESETDVEIALEPEAAALSCRIDLQSASEFLGNPDHLRYVVVDCGGGTVDMTVDDLNMSTGSINELHRASGGAWGGTEVDRLIMGKIYQAIGKDVALKLDRTAWLEFERHSVEEGKRVTAELQDASLKVPFALGNALSEAGIDLPTACSKVRGLSYTTRRGFVFSRDLLEECYKQPLDSIVGQIRELLTKVPNIHCLLVVGGFAESPLLINRIEQSFSDRSIRIIRPNDSSLSVLKGAVMYGQNPNIVQSRVLRYSYGVQSTILFEEGVHPERLRYKAGGVDYCRNIFRPFAHANENMKINNPISKDFYPTKRDSTKMVLVLHRSLESKVKYTSDAGCERLHLLELSMPRVEFGQERVVVVTMDFSRSSLTVNATDKSSGQNVTCTLSEA